MELRREFDCLDYGLNRIGYLERPDLGCLLTEKDLQNIYGFNNWPYKTLSHITSSDNMATSDHKFSLVQVGLIVKIVACKDLYLNSIANRQEQKQCNS